MRAHRMRQMNLFDDNVASYLPPLEEEVQKRVTGLLVQWMQALAKAIDAEVFDEQDQR